MPWLACNGVIYSHRSLNELLLPPAEKADEMEAVIPLRLKQTSNVATHRLEALALLLQQGFQFRFPEGTRQGQSVEYGLLAEAKSQVMLQGGGIVTLGLQDRVVMLQLLEPGDAPRSTGYGSLPRSSASPGSRGWSMTTRS